MAGLCSTNSSSVPPGSMYRPTKVGACREAFRGRAAIGRLPEEIAPAAFHATTEDDPAAVAGPCADVHAITLKPTRNPACQVQDVHGWTALLGDGDARAVG